MTTPSSLFLSHWLTQEDTALLAAADSLDEAGDVDRAEAVRLSLELEKLDAEYADACLADAIVYQVKAKPIAVRLAALKVAHVGPCPMCRDERKVYHSPSHTWLDCPTCVTAVRSRWDRLACERCKGKGRVRGDGSEFGYGDDGCPVCGGSMDLFQRFGGMVTGDAVAVSDRPIHIHRGLILVSATLEEAVEERETPRLAKCPECNGRGVRPSGFLDEKKPCSRCGGTKSITIGTGRIQRPSPWSAALLGARRDCGIILEDVEFASRNGVNVVGSRGQNGTMLTNLLNSFDQRERDAIGNGSAESSRLALAIAISRHLHSQIGG